MRRILRGVSLAILCPLLASAQENAALDQAFEAFWNAGSPKAAQNAVAGILATGATFAVVHERLVNGRPYKADVETGEIHWTTLPGGGARHATNVLIPRTYNKAVKYPVRVYLHGGVARPDPEETDEPGRVASGPPSRPRRRLQFKESYIAV